MLFGLPALGSPRNDYQLSWNDQKKNLFPRLICRTASLNNNKVDDDDSLRNFSVLQAKDGARHSPVF